jgi:predicted MFS family arabinose efflux permease
MRQAWHGRLASSRLTSDRFTGAVIIQVYLNADSWAGTYMPGFKAIADPLEGTAQSRAVSWHAAGVGISDATSFGIASLVGDWAGASASFLLGSATALGAVLIAATVMPSALSAPATTAPSRRFADFWPVLRNRATMSWIIGYTVHTGSCRRCAPGG